MDIFSIFATWLLSLTYLMLGISNIEKVVGGVNSTTRCGRVFITVSSLKNSYIELNWEINCGANDVRPTKISLYNKDIRDKNEKDVILYASVPAELYPDGFFRSNTTFNKDKWPENWRYNSTTLGQTGTSNFPYWIVSFSSNDLIIDIQSLKLQPTWMNDNREKLKSQQIGNLLIPGTHDSGCYNGVLLFKNYILTQDLSIWNQLVSGIRYLDLRIAYYQDNQFYINHDFIKIMKLEIVYKQIEEFIKRSPSEVIVLDFHRFPYPAQWSQDLHKEFINYTLNILGKYAFSRDDRVGYKGPTIEEIWKAKKNIILAYGQKQYVEGHPQLWKPVEQAWANTIIVPTLKQYLEEFMDRESSKYTMFNALMAELTPSALDILTSKNDLRKLANDVNSNLTKWVRDDWTTKVNIIATDFFLGNNLIQVAIDVNRNR